jgi:hypothetical protein
MIEWQEKLRAEYPELLAKLSYFEHGQGWQDLLINMFEKIKRQDIMAKSVDPKYVPTEFVQIKEKFGTLRAYCDGGDSFIYKIINAAEDLSAKTCEECGTTENVKQRSNKGWIYTSCDDHSKESKK